MIKNLLSPEIFCAVYLLMFSLLAPFTHSSTGSSTIILAGSLILLLIIHILVKIFSNIKSNYSFLIKASIVVLTLFLIDYGFRPNSDISGLLYSFILYGFFPLYFLSSISDYDKFIKSYCLLGIVNGVIMIKDPLQFYAWSGGYMPFGFNFMLPAFASSIILLFYCHYKIAIFPLVIFFMEMLIFANKGSILTALVLLFIGIAYINNGNKISRKVIIITVLCFFSFVLFFQDLFSFAIAIADSLGVDSYALTTIQMILADTSDNHVYDTRLDIWHDAMTTFNKNPVFGCGIGYFSSRNEGYEHNLILEVLNAWGVLGLSILIAVFYKCIRKFLGAQSQTLKVAIIVFAILGVVPLLSSLTLWIHMPFWTFLGLCFKSKRK